jgi:hypothetical protein
VRLVHAVGIALGALDRRVRDFASTAASTWVFVSPVSNCSSVRCGCDGSTVGALVELSVVGVASSAALALSAPSLGAAHAVSFVFHLGMGG